MAMRIGLAALAAGASLARAEQLSGRVTVRLAPPPRAMTVSNDTRICGTQRVAAEIEVSPDSGLANAVVSLLNPPAGDSKGLPVEAEVRQQGCTFVPHVVVLPKGGALRFVNSDPIPHQIRVVGALGASFNAMQTRNVLMSRRFEVPGEYPVRCDLHPWMSAWAVVVDHPYHAVTDADGRFSISAPPGTYRVRVWHEQLGVLSGELTTGKPAGFAFAPPEVTLSPPAPPAVVQPSATQTGEPPADLAQKLKSLQQLRDRGVLSTEEYRRMVDLLIATH
jgi:plastocyanin